MANGIYFQCWCSRFRQRNLIYHQLFMRTRTRTNGCHPSMAVQWQEKVQWQWCMWSDNLQLGSTGRYCPRLTVKVINLLSTLLNPLISSVLMNHWSSGLWRMFKGRIIDLLSCSWYYMKKSADVSDMVSLLRIFCTLKFFLLSRTGKRNGLRHLCCAKVLGSSWWLAAYTHVNAGRIPMYNVWRQDLVGLGYTWRENLPCFFKPKCKIC